MPTFNRQPEWQQPADRHTQLVDPVITVRQLSRFELSLKHVVRIDHALVFATPKNGYEAYLPPRRPTRSEIVAHRYTAVYEVDMGVHPFTGTLAFPSDNDAFEFTADVDLSWQVLDPARFVESGHRDVPKLLLGTLQQVARPVTRRFAIADSAAAEEELLGTLLPLEPLGASAGLQVTWTLRLKRDQANIEHQQRLQSIDHSATEQIRVAQRGTEVDSEVDARFRNQDQLQVERAMVYGRQHQEFALQQQAWQHQQAMLYGAQQHQLALQQGHQLLEMQQLEAQKIAFYQWHLQQGGIQAWALHLAQHPEDTGLVMNTMREDQLRMVQAQMDLVKELLSGDNAEKFELEGPKQLALRTVSDVLNQRLPGVQHNPPLIPQAPAADAQSYPGPGNLQTAGPTEPFAPEQGTDAPVRAAAPEPEQQGAAGAHGRPGHPGQGAAEQPSGSTGQHPQPFAPAASPYATVTGHTPGEDSSFAPRQQTATDRTPGGTGPSAHPGVQPPAGAFGGGAHPDGSYPPAPAPAVGMPYAGGPAAMPYPGPPTASAPTPGAPGWQTPAPPYNAPPSPYNPPPPPSPYAPPPPAAAVPGFPGAPGAPGPAGPAGPAVPYAPYPGALTPPPPPSMPPAWQPPPGYGSIPTAPPSHHPAAAPAPTVPPQQTVESSGPPGPLTAPATSGTSPTSGAPGGTTGSAHAPATPSSPGGAASGTTASADTPAANAPGDPVGHVHAPAPSTPPDAPGGPRDSTHTPAPGPREADGS